MDRPSSSSLRSPSPARTPQYSRPFGHSLRSATPLTDTPVTSASNGRDGTPASDRVMSGRIKKTPRKVARRKEDVLSEKEREEERRQLEDMDAERKLFPGSNNWAEDELRLFKILYMRQYSPLLPSTWDMDFRGIPIPDVLFASSDAHPPVVNSRSENDFKATRALTRLIDLTGNVRSLVQSGQRHRARGLIEKELRDYIKWAEQDGGYSSLDYVPNILIDVVDTSKTPREIEEHMQRQLRIVAANQRGHWRSGRMPDPDQSRDKRAGCHANYDTEEAEPEDNRVVLVPDKYPTKTPQKPQAALPSSRSYKGINGGDTRDRGLSSMRVGTGAAACKRQDEVYTRRPPVVYGLFIVNTSVMVLTIDSAKEDEAFASYQVEVGFSKRYQGVWNAITIAIVVCLARDAMMEMKADFNDSIVNGDSDPDA